MSKRTEEAFLFDILEASQRIRLYIEGMIYADFLADLKTQDSVIRNIEIIGEAVKNISSKLRAEHNHIAWKAMAGMRDRLIHEYFGVNVDIVWGVATEDIPLLMQEVNKILSAEK